MDKQQAAETIANKLLNGKCDTRLFSYIEEGAIAGWEAHEAQAPSDAVAFAEWIQAKGISPYKDWPGYWFDGNNKVSAEELYKLFNPSGAAPQEKKYPIGGYAPGNYYCKCATCQKEFRGDKRAVQCKPCAVKMTAEAAAPQAVGPVWMGGAPPFGIWFGWYRWADGSVLQSVITVSNTASGLVYIIGNVKVDPARIIKYLDESNTQQVFTRQQVSDALTAGFMILANIIKPIHPEATEKAYEKMREYMNKLYPPSI